MVGKEKSRISYIDNLRVLACFLVLLTHSTMPSTNVEADGFWSYGLSFIGSPSSELFLTISGTVLLPIKTDVKTFYRRRFIKLIPPLIIWSVLGVVLLTHLYDLPWSQSLDKIIRIPFQPAIPVYWFVYVMAGLYLLAPFITPWLKTASRRQIELFLAFWSINLIWPWISYFLPTLFSLSTVVGNCEWPLFYFSGFLGYWILGYYLNRYPIAIGLNLKFICLIVLSISYPLAIYDLKVAGNDTFSLTDNLQLGSAVFVAMLYTLLQNIKLGPKSQNTLSNLAKYSFGIYLTHIYIARELYWGIFDGSSIHIFPRTFFIAFLTLITGYLLTRIISCLPKSKYITGV